MIYRLEACVENTASAIKAIEAGADQIELCRDLHLDGLTPAIDEVEHCLTAISAPIKVMIRPRPGNFVVDDKTMDLMIEEVKVMTSIGVSHFVFGMTTSTGQLDLRNIERLINEIYPRHVTIHKAIDTCLDPVREAQLLVELGGVFQILTSGGGATAKAGAPIIRTMIHALKDEIEIVAAGSITYENLNEMHHLIKAPVYHGRQIVDM